jgi:hypothetical protein
MDLSALDKLLPVVGGDFIVSQQELAWLVPAPAQASGGGQHLPEELSG